MTRPIELSYDHHEHPSEGFGPHAHIALNNNALSVKTKQGSGCLWSALHTNLWRSGLLLLSGYLQSPRRWSPALISID